MSRSKKKRSRWRVGSEVYLSPGIVGGPDAGPRTGGGSCRSTDKHDQEPMFGLHATSLVGVVDWTAVGVGKYMLGNSQHEVPTGIS